MGHVSKHRRRRDAVDAADQRAQLYNINAERIKPSMVSFPIPREWPSEKRIPAFCEKSAQEILHCKATQYEILDLNGPLR